MDKDVASERDRILGSAASTDEHVLRVADLRKVYTSRGQVKVGVDGISFGVTTNECFGLLGVNGAGKTSTFKMCVRVLFIGVAFLALLANFRSSDRFSP